MKRWDWQGNVRQLRNICQRLCVLTQTGIITEADVWEVLEDAAGRPVENLLTPEEQQLYELVRRKQSKAELAKKLGVSRSTLWRKTKDISKI